MGPQLVRCGKQLTDGIEQLMAVLQWGRNLFVAERGASDELPSAIYPTFNGAATCSLRKVCIKIHTSIIVAMTFNGAATCSLRKGGQ